VLTIVATGIVTSAGTYFATRVRIRHELTAQYDADLRKQRIEAYRVLWSALKPFARYGRSKPVPEKSDLQDVTEAMRDWYFDTGGIYLSSNAREAYFRVQRTLTRLLESDRWQRDGRDAFDEEAFLHLLDIMSRLRTRLTLDVGTRRPFSLEQPSDVAREDQPDTDEVWITEHWPPAT
jgi:hypothetical protein